MVSTKCDSNIICNIDENDTNCCTEIGLDDSKKFPINATTCKMYNGKMTYGNIYENSDLSLCEILKTCSGKIGDDYKQNKCIGLSIPRDSIQDGKLNVETSEIKYFLSLYSDQLKNGTPSYGKFEVSTEGDNANWITIKLDYKKRNKKLRIFLIILGSLILCIIIFINL